MGMFVAKGIELGDIETEEIFDDATAAGRGYSVAGGVADAIANCVDELYPNASIKVDRAEGLAECAKMLKIAQAGKRNGYLMEGMACPGGCIGGAGTMMAFSKASAAVKKFQAESPDKIATRSKYVEEEEE